MRDVSLLDEERIFKDKSYHFLFSTNFTQNMSCDAYKMSCDAYKCHVMHIKRHVMHIKCDES